MRSVTSGILAVRRGGRNAGGRSLRPRHVLVRVVAAAHEGTGLAVDEAERQGESLAGGEQGRIR